MKLLASIIKSFKENLRDWKVLVMVLVFSPFFLLLMYLFYGGDPTMYTAGIINLDHGKASAELIETIESIEGSDGNQLFNLITVNDDKDIEVKVQEKVFDIGIVIPSDYSKTIASASLRGASAASTSILSSSKHNKSTSESSSSIIFYGSMSNIRYPVAAVMIADSIQSQGMSAINITLPVAITEVFLEKNSPLNEFDSYVPGLITLSILMILFTASASIVRENDKKTLIRLKLSRLGAFNFLVGICIVQAIIAVGALILSYWTALGLGYQAAGSFTAVLFVGVISSLSMVAISLVVASFLQTIFDVLTIGCFPFFLLMFFSGSMFPLPQLSIFTVHGHSLGITDLLPLTHTVNAFNRILNYGAGLNEIAFDIFMIVLLTVVYFLIGLALYQKRRLAKA